MRANTTPLKTTGSQNNCDLTLFCQVPLKVGTLAATSAAHGCEDSLAVEFAKPIRLYTYLIAKESKQGSVWQTGPSLEVTWHSTDKLRRKTNK
eukprot:4456176-Amphidinium_carterae.1